ncbi:tubulin alpha-1 chain-like protein [Geranomyces variabilis]|nr:tubulin alpha-1 chain-like protein [Geranomyces variabilis]
MRECISIHVGQAGVQIGNACWELYCLGKSLPSILLLFSSRLSAQLHLQLLFVAWAQGPSEIASRRKKNAVFLGPII